MLYNTDSQNGYIECLSSEGYAISEPLSKPAGSPDFKAVSSIQGDFEFTNISQSSDTNIIYTKTNLDYTHASSDITGKESGYAFDGDNATEWETDPADSTYGSDYITLQTNINQRFHSIDIIGHSDSNLSPTNFTIEGSINNSAWYTLANIANTTWTSGETKSYNFDSANTDWYDWYRISITSSTDGTKVGLAEIKFHYLEDVDQLFTTEPIKDGDSIVIVKNDNSIHELTNVNVTDLQNEKIWDYERSIEGNDRFGQRVAISDNYMAVGDTSLDRVTIYDLAGNLINTIYPPSGYSGYDFGTSVALTDTHVLIGQPDYSSSQGLAWLCNIDGSDMVNIASTVVNDLGYYGRTLALSDTHIVIGNPECNDAGSLYGAVHIWNFDPTQTNNSDTFTNERVAYGTGGNRIANSSMDINDTYVIVNYRNTKGPVLIKLSDASTVATMPLNSSDAYSEERVAINSQYIYTGNKNNDSGTGRIIRYEISDVVANGTSATPFFIYEKIPYSGHRFGRSVACNETTLMTSDDQGSFYSFIMNLDGTGQNKKYHSSTTRAGDDMVINENNYYIMGNDDSSGTVYCYYGRIKGNIPGYYLGTSSITDGEVPTKAFRTNERVEFNNSPSYRVLDSYSYDTNNGKLLTTRDFARVELPLSSTLTTKVNMSATGNKMISLDFKGEQ
jgi:hypothetical protein